MLEQGLKWGIQRMKFCLHASLTAVGWTLGLLLSTTAFAQIDSGGYRPPHFSALAQQNQMQQMQQRPTTPMPASPLAGGMSAAGGDAFMDAHGNPIVMPANYCQGGCQAGCQGGCPDGACGYGGGGYNDGMAVDFGGYSTPDQCGPHYFDVSAEVVYLKGDDLFEGVPAFTSQGVGINAPKFLDPGQSSDDYEPGWRIAARYDIGPLSVLEATYMGLYDIAFSDQVLSVDVTNPPTDFQLFSVFSQFGTGTLIPGIDDGRVHRLNFESDLQSTEFSYRRYWVGTNPRVSGTFLLGFRYLRLTDDLTFSAEGLVAASTDTGMRMWSGENDLVGAQLGGDGWVCLRQGLRVGGEAKAGIYNNRFKFNHSADLPGTSSDFSSDTAGNQVAFATEGSVTMVMDILPSLSLRGGYQVLYLNSLATAANNVDTSNFNSTAVLDQAHVLYHGFNGGLEYIW